MFKTNLYDVENDTYVSRPFFFFLFLLMNKCESTYVNVPTNGMWLAGVKAACCLATSRSCFVMIELIITGETAAEVA